jgi:hypothetical protein
MSSLELPPTTSQILHPLVYHHLSSLEKFTIVPKDKSAHPNAVVRQKVYKQNYDHHDITKYLIMHYECQHIPGHIMQSILLLTTIPKGSFIRTLKKSILGVLAASRGGLSYSDI